MTELLKTMSTCHGNLCGRRGAAGARAGSDTAGRAERERALVMEEADLDTERLVQPAPASASHMVTSLPAAFSGSSSSGWRSRQVPCLDAAQPLLADIPQQDCSLETHYPFHTPHLICLKKTDLLY